MKLVNNGLAKLLEKSGEVSQVAAKMIQFPHLQLLTTPHPDGTVLREELENELGDLAAIMEYVRIRLRLDTKIIQERHYKKFQRFCEWDTGVSE